MKIVGIDPGLASTGIAVIQGKGIQIEDYAYGSIETPSSLTLPNRLDQIFTGVIEVLADHMPDLMVVEDVFSLDKYPKSGIMLGKVSGVILLAGYRNCTPVLEIPVREAKQVLTGNGNASKQQLEKSVRHILNQMIPIKPFHASDAMALAMIGLFRYANLSDPGIRLHTNQQLYRLVTS